AIAESPPIQPHPRCPLSLSKLLVSPLTRRQYFWRQLVHKDHLQSHKQPTGKVMARVIHFEIHAENPDRAVKFYKDLFGWEFTKWDGPQPYWLIKTGPDGQPGINGGMVPRRGTIDG